MLIHEDDLKKRVWHLQNMLAEKAQALLAITEERDRLRRENCALRAENTYYADTLIRAAIDLGLFDDPYTPEACVGYLVKEGEHGHD